MAKYNLDAFLIFLMLSGKAEAVESAVSKGITPELIRGEQYKKAFDVIAHQCHSEGTVPTIADIQSMYGPTTAVSTGFDIAWVISQIHLRNQFHTMAHGVEELEGLLTSHNTVHARQLLLELAEKLAADPSLAVNVTNLFKLGPAVKAEYVINEEGGIAIPLPWATMNKMTRGLYPGSNTWILARPGTGKTWILVVIAVCAWIHGQETGKPINVLIVSPEMSKEQCAERIFTLLAKVSYGQVVGATLGEYGKQEFFDSIDSFFKSIGIFVIDASDGLSPGSIAMAIEQVSADVVAIDSVYKIKWKERAKDKYENMYEGVD